MLFDGINIIRKGSTDILSYSILFGYDSALQEQSRKFEKFTTQHEELEAKYTKNYSKKVEEIHHLPGFFDRYFEPIH